MVTGCAGFIGSHLTDRLLAEGYKVDGIDCFTDYYSRDLKERNIAEALKNENFNLIERDILDITRFPEVDYVFHEAAQAGVRGSWGKNFEVYTRNNIEATQRLLEHYKDKPLKKFVYASSSSVYGDAKLPMSEDSVPKPVSPYGVTKLAGENLCYLYWKNYGIPCISLRYFTVYGPRQRPDMAINKFVKAISNGDEITIFGDGTQTRDFTFVSDIVNANVLAAESECSGEVFNVGGGSRISVNELIRAMEQIIGKKANIKFCDAQKGDAKDTLADNKKARIILGWKPNTGICEGLIKYLEYKKENQG